MRNNPPPNTDEERPDDEGRTFANVFSFHVYNWGKRLLIAAIVIAFAYALASMLFGEEAEPDTRQPAKVGLVQTGTQFVVFLENGRPVKVRLSGVVPLPDAHEYVRELILGKRVLVDLERERDGVWECALFVDMDLEHPADLGSHLIQKNLATVDE